MMRRFAVLLLACTLCADAAADRKAIQLTIGALYNPLVRSDAKRLAEIVTADFDGNLNMIPVRTIWCELACEGFRVISMKFVTEDVVVVDGENTPGTPPSSRWLMILTKDPVGWRVSDVRSSTPASPVAGSH